MALYFEGILLAPLGGHGYHRAEQYPSPRVLAEAIIILTTRRTKKNEPILLFCRRTHAADPNKL